jgi:Rieske 2Fe-2S family protein
MVSATLASTLIGALADTLKPLAEARTLPSAVFTDPSIHALELRELFGRRWIAVARAEELGATGAFVTQEIGGERVLIVRAEDGNLRAFFNVCRHRGSRLVEEPAGRLHGAIACPYHAWTYALDGQLKRAPHFDPDPQHAQDLGLVQMPLVVHEGLVFVVLEPGTSAVAVELPDLARFGLSRLNRVRRLEYAIAANWKLVCENYSECYHCPQVHPQLNRLAELASGGFESGAGFNGGPMRLRAGVETLSMSGRSHAPRLATLGGEADAMVYYYLVYPNLMLGIHPDYLTTHVVWPLAPDRSRIVCELCYAPEAGADAAFDPAECSEFWDLTNRQDWALCERVQRGAASHGYRPGPYHPNERCVHAFDRWYARWLTASIERTAAAA